MGFFDISPRRFPQFRTARSAVILLLIVADFTPFFFWVGRHFSTLPREISSILSFHINEEEVSKRLKRERRALSMRRHPWGVFLFHEIAEGENVALARFLSFGDHRKVFPGKLPGFGHLQDVGVAEFFGIASAVRSCIIDVPCPLSGGSDPQKEFVKDSVSNVVPLLLRLYFRDKGIGEFFGHGITSRTRYVLRLYYKSVSARIQEDNSKNGYS